MVLCHSSPEGLGHTAGPPRPHPLGHHWETEPQHSVLPGGAPVLRPGAAWWGHVAAGRRWSGRGSQDVLQVTPVARAARSLCRRGGLPFPIRRAARALGERVPASSESRPATAECWTVAAPWAKEDAVLLPHRQHALPRSFLHLSSWTSAAPSPSGGQPAASLPREVGRVPRGAARPGSSACHHRHFSLRSAGTPAPSRRPWGGSRDARAMEPTASTGTTQLLDGAHSLSRDRTATGRSLGLPEPQRGAGLRCQHSGAPPCRLQSFLANLPVHTGLSIHSVYNLSPHILASDGSFPRTAAPERSLAMLHTWTTTRCWQHGTSPRCPQVPGEHLRNF